MSCFYESIGVMGVMCNIFVRIQSLEFLCALLSMCECSMMLHIVGDLRCVDRLTLSLALSCPVSLDIEISIMDSTMQAD